MDSHIFDWFNLIFRWLHVIFAVAWIGSSIFFVWMNNAVRPLEGEKRGVAGGLWMIHGGAYYNVEKLKTSPEKQPEVLHWFMWEAYLTWITGFVLMILIYYLNAKVYLIDPSVANLSVHAAIAIGIGSLVVGWFIYDFLWLTKFRHSGIVVVVLSFLLVAGFAFVLSQVFSGRGAFIHVGVMLGTIMAANVWRRIIPGQKKAVAASQSGGEVNPDWMLIARQRSLHNNYIVLPVVFVMISSHYPSTFGHPFNWAILMGLALASGLIRHYINRKEQGKKLFWLLPVAGATLIALVIVTMPRSNKPAVPNNTVLEEVSFEKARQVINQRCVSCHSASPTDQLFTIAPNGVKFDTPQEIQVQAERIKNRAVDTKTMPLANMSGITDAERAILGAWVDSGAQIK